LPQLPEGPMSTAQANALVVALIYERAGEPTFHGSRGVNFCSLHVLQRRGLVEREDQDGGFRLTEAGRALARSLKGELSPPA
jgi:hypothetical protein